MPERQKLAYPNNVVELSSTLKNKFLVARVTDIILDITHKNFKAYGGYNAIGTIFWEENTLRGSSNRNTVTIFRTLLARKCLWACRVRLACRGIHANYSSLPHRLGLQVLATIYAPRLINCARCLGQFDAVQGTSRALNPPR